MDPELYRRRQRRRAIIGWSVPILLVALVAIVVAFGGNDRSGSGGTSYVGLAEPGMSTAAYEQIHDGQGEGAVLELVGVVGQSESEIESELLQLFPAAPAGSSCQFWVLSEAPNHHVRLCFGGTRPVLLEKSVVARGEDAAPQVLA